jgi:ABC-type multidrug transport system ATPase subunit
VRTPSVFKDICKAYGSRTLLNGIDLIIRRNDRVALIGANGCGKSTLIRILTGEETPDQGHVKIGNSIRPAYLPQVIEFENNTATVLETVRYALETNEERARKILARFHFRGSDVQKMTGNLSGGEKSRLKLCLLMQQDINLLILDEPTNHLDIQSREWIEEALSGYGGTILFVSHDRYFINKFADRVWELKDGSITDFDGTYAEYCQWLSMTANREKAAPYGRDAAKGAVRNADPGSTASREGNKADLSRKTSREGNGEEPGWKVSREANEEDLSRNASRKGNRPGRDRRGNENSSIRKASEIKVCEEKIGLAELRLSRLNEEMETSASDFEKLNELFAQKKEIEDELDQLYSKWGELTC